MLDASMTLAWHFADEQDAEARALAARAAEAGAHVPGHWAAEVANGLLMGEHRGRTSGDAIAGFVERLDMLPLTIDRLAPNETFLRIVPLARAHRLTVYDALYLELSERLGLPLATRDKPLGDAARSVGIEIIGAQP